MIKQEPAQGLALVDSRIQSYNNKAMTNQTAKKEIVPWVDLIRVVAIFLVVVIHVSGQLTNDWGKIPTEQWLIADIYDGTARVAVPLFFMLSGYLLLPRSESLSVFYRKRMAKILIPLAAWSLIYLGWYCGNHPGTCTPEVAWGLLLPPGPYYHLWFLYSLLSVYLILPVLRLMFRPDTDQKILWYFIVLWLIFQPILTLAHKLWGFSIYFSIPLTGSYTGFFVLGYLLGQVTLSRPRIILSALIFVIASLVTAAGAYFLTRASGQLDSFFYQELNLNVILASGAAFLLLRWLSERKLFTSPQALAVTRSLATAAFGVYLLHVIVMEVVGRWIPFMHINASMGNALWSIPFVSIIVFLVSFLIIRILQKIPILERIVP